MGPVSLSAEVAAARIDPRPVRARCGFDLRTPFRTVTGGVIHGEELDRFEVRLAAGVSGYLRMGGELGPLPIGSRLDAATGLRHGGSDPRSDGAAIGY